MPDLVRHDNYLMNGWGRKPFVRNRLRNRSRGPVMNGGPPSNIRVGCDPFHSARTRHGGGQDPFVTNDSFISVVTLEDYRYRLSRKGS